MITSALGSILSFRHEREICQYVLSLRRSVEKGKDSLYFYPSLNQSQGSTFPFLILLKAAANGENFEWITLYQNFAEVAKKEGFMEVYETFTQVAKMEKFHDSRYLGLLRNVKEGKMFKKDAPVKWHCRNCGYVFEGKEVPEKCPVCKHPRNYMEVLAENY